jgi:subtilisin family serine protease
MRNFTFIILLIAGLCFSDVLHAQDIDVPIRFAKGNFITGNNISRQNFKPSDLQPSLFGNQYFLLLQFSGLPSLQTREQLKNAGVQLGDYIPGNAYFATMPAGFDFNLAASYKIISVNSVPAEYKIEPAVFTYNNGTSKIASKLVAITFNTVVNKKAVEDELKKTGAAIVHTKMEPVNVVFIEPASPNTINNIAALAFVDYISLQQLNATALNNNDIALHGFSSIQSTLGRNLRGKNMTIGIGDNADISTHMDFSGRLINRVFSTPAVHGTHTSGTTAGAGIINPLYQGMAPKSTIISQWFNDIITNTPVYVADNNMIATNNSYTTADAGCAGEGVYDVTSNYVDAQMKSYDEVLHVFAAGNDGLLTCSSYPAAYATIKSGWQTAKNVITVGNIFGTTYAIATNSSRGPVKDGRIKPEIVTSGVNIMSTQLSNGYVTGSGTSMSAPVVTGGVALLNERYSYLVLILKLHC